ncbi:MAG: sialidase family protein [Planctomycetota bacterium]
MRLVGVLVVLIATAGTLSAQDARDITTGYEIPSIGYADQPFVVTLNDGSWLCVLTTGPGEEGATGQHVAATRSTDFGRTWSELVAIEPPSSQRGGESSWAVPLHVRDQGSAEFGRVYAFYVFNGDPVTSVPNRAAEARLDTLGWYVYRHSDDGGRTWSPRRRIEMPNTLIDRRSTFGGRVQMFWGCSEPLVLGGRVLLAFTKIRVHHVNETEGWLVASDNLLTEPDPSRHVWELVANGNMGPEAGWIGLRNDDLFGKVQSEHAPAALDTPGSALMLNRTDRGVISFSTTVDGGRMWSTPDTLRYADGRPIRNPRANAKAWRISPGRYLLWHHNHGGTDFQGRNPAWLSGGVARDDGTIAWGEPEILLYGLDPSTRISYPDLIVHEEQAWITETQKSIARVHPIDPALISGLFEPFEGGTPSDEGLVAELDADRRASAFEFVDLGRMGGFTLEALLTEKRWATPKVLASAMDDAGRGWTLTGGLGGVLTLGLRDDETTYEWSSDPMDFEAGGLTRGELETRRPHRVCVIVDGPADVVRFVVDGVQHDGGASRQYGWGRMPATLGALGGSGAIRLGDPGTVAWLRVYDRAMSTSRAVIHTREAAESRALRAR